MLPILAALSLFSAWGVHRLAPVNLAAARRAARTQDSAPKAASGLRVVARVPYLRNLAALALIAALGAAMVDYLLKVGAVRSLGRGENLLRFFAIYYAATSLLTFVMQTSFSRVALEKLGLGLTTASHSLALLAGSAMALLAPGFGSVITARAGETVFRGSFFRSGYELFYTPIPAAEKRPAKSIIDVGFDRLGDAAGGGIVRLVLVVAPAAQYSIILMVAMACSVGAIALARRLNRGYIQSLEKSLLNRALELDLSDVEDRTTRTIMVRTLNRPATALRRVDSRVPADAPVADPVMVSDPEVQQIIDLRSGDRERILRVLDQDEGIAPAVVPHAVRLLAWDPVAEDAIFALKKVAEEHIGLLTDSLIDPNQDFAVRRRLAQVFSVCVSQRAADGLMLGLEDLRFEVRFRCGRSLAALLEKNPRIRIDASLVSEIVLREVNVGRPVWESHRLLDGLDDGVRVSFVDEFLRDRTNQSLAHVFTLLSLILPRAPLLIAYRGLHTTDQHLRGTALEYLESVLPAAVRTRLWPFLEDSRSPARSTRTRTEILDELLQSNQSIILNLEEMKRHVKRVAAAGPSTTARS
jgi:hypothetical protein